MNKITNPMVLNRQKKKALVLRAFIVAITLALFSPIAQAQTNVYMKDGNRTIQRTDAAISFYDSHGPSGAAANYWETWYNHNENFTYVFKPAVSGDKIKVTFNTFQCWAEPASGSTGVDIGRWALRLNDDYLYIYEGNGAVDANLIAELTGNTRQSFSVMTDGAITFKFVSNARYREEGWYATVELVTTGGMAPQAPLIQRSTCSDQVEIFPTTHNARIIYCIGDNDPQPGDPLAPPTYEYTGPISFPEGTIPSTGGFKVNAMAQLVDGDTWSTVTHAVFQESDRVPFPDASNTLAHTTITRVDGTNTIVMTPAERPKGLNDTYQVRYTMSTNGTEPAEPTLNNSQPYTGPITASVNGTIYRAKTFAVSCSNQCSAASVSYVVNGIYAPAPVIDFNEMTITSEEGNTVFDILYTVDGTDPAISGTTLTGTFNDGIVDLSSLNPALTYGQTVKALAYMATNENGAPDANYTASQVVTAIYMPTDENGNTVNGLYGDIVILDDREDHSWAYYNKGGDDNPIHSLSPTDVKITYTGYGTSTMTSSSTANKPGRAAFTENVDSDKVAVNKDEAGNQFIYLKTLENDDPEGEGNTYSYTMIANPFQKRPVYGDVQTTTYTSYDKVTSASDLTSGSNYLLVYDNGSSSVAFNGETYSSYYGGTTSVSVSNGVISDPGSAAILTLQSTGSYYFLKNGSNNIGINRTTYQGYYYYDFTQGTGTGNAYQWTVTYNNGYVRFLNRQYTSYYLYFGYDSDEGYLLYNTNSTSDINVSLFKETEHTSTTGGDYRGFYAWRVKTMSSGLSIKAGSTTYTSSDINTGDGIILYPDQDIQFITDAEDGNEVEFEALWAKAYVTTGTTAMSSYAENNGDYKNAYDRNFHVVTSLPTHGTYPYTVTTLNPDGSGTLGSISGTSYSCSNDVKLENMTLSMSSYLNANNHSLHIGRGVSNGSSNVATAVYGRYLDNQTSTTFTSNSFTLRVESGRYSNSYLFHNDQASRTSSEFTCKTIFGSDYDRASQTSPNGKLTIAGPFEVGYYVNVMSANSKINVCVLSGTFGTSSTNTEFYMGYELHDNDYACIAPRHLEVLGGAFSGGIAGGVDGEVDSETEVLTMRIKGGTVSQYQYGSGQHSTAYGTRKTIITGGTFNCWIAGACYGTYVQNPGSNDYSGKTVGDTYVYVGGDAAQNNNDGVFGAGYGENTTQTDYYTVLKSFVVVADDATITGSVYGGGNNGYNKSDAKVYVLGGGKNKLTVSGSVFGGANQARSAATTTVTVENGTVNGSVYGGANTSGAVADDATVNVSGGTVKGSVFGAGYGTGTSMTKNTIVNVTGGTIETNVYGGGQLGSVSGNTTVNFEGGTVKNIYGAGKGTEVATPGASASANVAQGTTVNVKGGLVNGDVYGGGEYGTVAFVSDYGTSNYNSIVSISGGEVKGDVLGGGKMGTTQGKTTVNVSGTWDGTVIRGNVFAGAYGKHDKIYVAGLKTLNISGGRIYGSIYGGSRNANDGNTINASTGTAATCITNISGGRIDQHVYAAGYYGSTKGSVYAFIGLNAINGAPNSPHSATNATPYTLDKGSILIGGSVWAGGDWGVFTGTFGSSTITGNSNIYINGEGYSTNSNDQSATNYMNIQGSILGCGTSCDAGSGERTLILSHYGADMPNSGTDSDENPFASASRQVNTIQRFHNVIFDDAHLGFLGQGKINSLNNTEKYSLYEIDQNVYLANGSTMVMNVPSSQIYSFHSVTCPDTYAASPSYTVVNYDGLGDTPGGDTDNKVRVNGGSYVEIKYIPEGEPNGVIPDAVGSVTVDFETGDLNQLNNSTSGIECTNDDTYPWVITDIAHNDGSYSMKSGNAGVNSSTSTITVTANFIEGGSISFSGRASCEETTTADWDNGRFFIDGVQQGSNILNSTTFSSYSYTVSAGSHTFMWRFKKDSSVAGNDDCFYVDDITFTGVAVENTNPNAQPIYYAGYGQLEGFAHMMAGNPDEDATCAYARPKQSTEEGNILVDANVFNANDGGWVSYDADENEYDADGGLASVTEEEGVQLRYENHHPNMRDNSEYYRIWRKGSDHHTLEAVVNAHAEGSTGVYKTVEVEVELPSWRAAGSYFRFDRTNNSTNNNTLIDYGSDVMTFNGANYTDPLGAETWMYYDDDADAQVTGVQATNATVAAAIGANGILSNPNLNFGLVIKPGLTMMNTDVNYIINSTSDEYLASVEKPFNCKDNTHKPTLKLVLTYSDKLSANASLDPVLLKLVQCDAQGNITDYVTIKLIINTSMNITSGFTTQIYARMDGSANTRETAMVPVVLPTFNVAEAGENARFYLQKVEFVKNGGVVIKPDVHGESVVCAETRESASSSGTMLNIDRFAMTIAALPNPDNSDDWRNVTGPQDAVQQPNSGYGTLVWDGSNNRGVHLGDGKGRNPLAFGFTMYFNSNEEADGKSKMGDMVFTILVENIENGSATTMTFPITIEVYRLGSGENFYVDGINGQDLDDVNRAKFPDKAAKTVNFIFNRLGYKPGDNIIVVNTLPIAKNTTWDGSRFQNNVKIYRYPGGHKLTTGGTSTETNENLPYLGPLVDVTNTLHMKGIIMDGMYAESTAPVGGVHNPKLYPTGDAGNCTFNGIAEAPLITISNGARVNLTDTQLQNNYNSKTDEVNAGGAVHVTYEGILAMNSTNRITANYNKNGGGVYVDGSMIVSDYAYVYDNYSEAVSGSKATLEQNNVMLEDVTDGTFRVVQVGTSDSNDAFDALLETGDAGETKIGVTKDDWDHAYDGYMPVVYAEAGSLSYLNDPYNTQSMVVHDDNVFKLERYVSTEYSDSPNYLYWLGTWVTAVTWNPYFESREVEGYTNDFTAAQLANIHTPQQLAWAISLVNGENGCTPAPNTSFTLTDDIDMAANIWVPIGTETALYNGTFEGNGHVVTGLRGSITRTDMGMFGRTNTNAKIQNMVVSTKFNTNSDNVGTVVGNMVGGTLSNVEGAGENTSRNNAGNNGGLVGVNGGGTIHSAFAVTTLKGGENVGGLVAVNNSSLFNSYSAADMSDGTAMAGLVATNAGRVENCYDATNAEVAFAVKNSGTIRYCYTAEAGEDETPTYVSGSAEGSTLEKHGTYGAVMGIKELGYMYGDNKVTAAEDETIGYVKTTHEYVDNHIVVWDGLLSVLNQWVADGNVQGKPAGLSTWNRPLTQALNGDLPVLAFPKDNCVGNYTTEDGKMLRYSASDEVVIENGAATQANNGLDNLLKTYKDKEANLFLYGSAIEVAEVPTEKVNVFVNEDAVLMQKQQPNGTKANEADFINTTVGITFDNSSKKATDIDGTILTYDWHLMSTPLADAKLGISYTEGATLAYGQPADWNKVENSYMPNMTNESKGDDDPEAEEDDSVKWDFYTYYEPEYHWINFKRSKGNHWHYDEPHDNIAYNGTEQTGDNILEPGRGYMMAINQESYLNQTGTLNNGDVEIELTLSGDQSSDTEPTKDWGSNLIGNPYQAYLDLDVVSDETGLESFYVYDADNSIYGPYMTGASINPAIPSQFIHPHQAFFTVIDEAYVEAYGDNSGKADYEPKSVNVKFTYEMATADKETTSYFRGNKQPDYPVVNIFVTNEKGSRDLAIIELDRPELNGVRKIENLRNTNFKVYARYEGNNYGLLFTPAGAQKVPVHFKTMEDGKFTMTWSTYNGTFTNLVLVDNLTGVRCNMLTNDHYTFEGSVDDYAARFFITFNVTDVDEINGENGDFAWFDGNDWIVTGNGQLDVIDVTGRVLQSQRVNGEQVRLHLDNVAAGVYMMRLSEGNRAKTQKIVIR